MGKADYYAPGEHNKICDRTGFKIKSSNARKEWNNQIVRAESWEQRQPQDLIRSRPDNQQVADPRTESGDSFIGTNDALEDITGVQVVTWLANPSQPEPARRIMPAVGDFLIVER